VGSLPGGESSDGRAGRSALRQGLVARSPEPAAEILALLAMVNSNRSYVSGRIDEIEKEIADELGIALLDQVKRMNRRR
jgi:hypothetical protein